MNADSSMETSEAEARELSAEQVSTIARGARPSDWLVAADPPQINSGVHGDGPGLDIDPKSTVGDLAKHVGAWETSEGFVCFGSWMAVAAMHHLILKGAAEQWKQMYPAPAVDRGLSEAARKGLANLQEQALKAGNSWEWVEFESRSIIAAIAASAPSQAEPVAALLVRDIAADFGVVPLEVCRALLDLGFGHLSINMAVTTSMARKLREHFYRKPAPGLAGSCQASGEVDRESVHDALGECLDGVWDCTRVWSAWSVGTMSQDDFVPVAERLDEITDAVLKVLTPPAGRTLTEIPTEIIAIAERLHTQDNRITDNPLFGVQQKRRVYGLDEDYEDAHGWAHPDRDSLVLEGEPEYAELKAAWESGEEPRGDWRRVGFKDTWEFVTGCLTEQGCKDFIRVNGHNLHEPRIYAYGSYRNAEFIALRKWLMSLLPAPAGDTQPNDGHKAQETACSRT